MPQTTWDNLSTERRQHYLDIKVRADWLQANPPPADASSPAYAEWVRNNPHSTQADRARATLIETLGQSGIQALQAGEIGQEHVVQALTPSLKELKEQMETNPNLEGMSEAEVETLIQTTLNEETEKTALENDFVPLIEKEGGNGILPIKIIQPGWGSSGYYSHDVLSNAASH